MKINKKSWHYKLLNATFSVFSTDMPKSLCTYFWCVVLWLPLHVFLAACMLIIGPILGIVWLWERYGPEKNYSRDHGLVVSYIKAKKAKICPILEFEDDKDK